MPKKLLFLLRCQLIFPTSRCLSMSVLLLLKATKTSEPQNQTCSNWIFGVRDSDADRLLSFSLSHMLLLMMEDDGSFGVREERRSRVGFAQRCSDLWTVAFSLYQLCFRQWARQISCKLAVSYCWLWEKKVKPLLPLLRLFLPHLISKPN